MQVQGQLVIIAILMAFFAPDLQGQSDFREGYIITLTQDTLIGEIDNKNYHQNSQFCDFRQSKSDSIIRFYPDKLTGYRFAEGKFYISKKIKGKSTYLEYLINGELDIYFYQDEFGTNHFYVSKDSASLKELVYKKGVMMVDGKQMSYQSKPYIGLLSYYTSDQPELQEKILKLNGLTHKNLINFSEEYHNANCPEEQCIIYEKTISRKIILAMNGGSNYFFRHFTELEQRTYPTYGIKALFQQSEWNERIYLGIGYVNEGKIDSLSNFIRIPLSINYVHSRQGISPLVGYGFDLNYFGAFQSLSIGMRYKFSKVSFFVDGAIKTILFTNPYSVSANFGMIYELR